MVLSVLGDSSRFLLSWKSLWFSDWMCTETGEILGWHREILGQLDIDWLQADISEFMCSMQSLWKWVFLCRKQPGSVLWDIHITTGRSVCYPNKTLCGSDTVKYGTLLFILPLGVRHGGKKQKEDRSYITEGLYTTIWQYITLLLQYSINSVDLFIHLH